MRQAALFSTPADLIFSAYLAERRRYVRSVLPEGTPPTNRQRSLVALALREFDDPARGAELLQLVMVGAFAGHPAPQALSLDLILEKQALWEQRAERGAEIMAQRAAPAEEAPTPERRAAVLQAIRGGK